MMAAESHRTYRDGELIDTGQVTVPDAVPRERRARAAIEANIDTLTDAATNWASLTAAQRTQAMLVAIKTVVLCARVVLRKFDTDNQPDA